jgi:predicted permease
LAALALALSLSIFNLKFLVPETLVHISDAIGVCAVPLMLITIGASLYGTPDFFKNKYDIFYLSIIRLFLIPLLCIFILRLFPIPEDLYNVAFIVSIMPASVGSAVVTRKFGGSPEFAAQAALVTTLASIATIPLMLFFL